MEIARRAVRHGVDAIHSGIARVNLANDLIDAPLRRTSRLPDAVAVAVAAFVAVMFCWAMCI
jgi:hypothetical protein